MRKTLTYSSFITANIIVILAFVTATTYIQLGIAVLLYPLLAYFAFKLLPRKAEKAPVITLRLPAKPARKTKAQTAQAEKERVAITDLDKRAFLKLIGGAGLSFFLFSLLGRRVETLLFGQTQKSATAPTGSAQPSPTEGYRISEIDDGDSVTYYGFINNSGGWFVMKEDQEGSFRYAKGDLNFPNAWARRTHLKYDYFHNLF